jgi:transposase
MLYYTETKGEKKMAYRYGDRNQMNLFPQSIEQYVTKDDPVRAYDTFVEALDLESMGIERQADKVGNSEYEPKTMMKLLVYGYSYGLRSSRKLERAVYHNVSFIWLMGGLKPDHKTISRFRRNNRDILKRVLKQCAKICIELDLIAGNILFIDGTKIRANAGRGKNYTKEYYDEQLSKVDKRIDELLDECERIDCEESQQESFVKMKKELTNNKELRKRIKGIIEQFKEQDEQSGDAVKTINQTDPESALMRSIQGSHASYNVQSVVDDKHGLIVHMESVSDTSDVNQFATQITQAEEVIDKECETASADSGYADTEELEKIDQRGTKVIVPSQRQALHNSEKPFSKSKFTYDKEGNCYYCPEGQKLTYLGRQDNGKKLGYRISDANICKRCNHYGSCTGAKMGRKIVRLANEEVKERLERQYEQVESQQIYARRKARVEHPFGHIKRNLGITSFLLRGRLGAQAEISIAATCFNIVRMITIFGGVKELIVELTKRKRASIAFCGSGSIATE